ncbi:MAG TPA: hypothetical protein VJ598_05465, partial [Albitalea sp.]|nr:hypothetical protein [Albitalea sp.]
AVEQMAVLHAHHPKGFLEELHYHAAMWEVFIFHEPARYLICGHEYTLAAGDVVVLEPGDAHGAVPVDHEVNITVLQLPPVSGDKVLMPASAA